jgi:hypothetical protein
MMKRLTGGLTGLVITLALSGCSSMCSDEIRGTATSADKQHVATTHSRECGATTDWYSSVVLNVPNQAYKRNEVIFSVKGDFWPDIEWKSNTDLTVRCEACRRKDIGMAVSKWADVDIHYDLGFERELPKTPISH